MKLGMHPDRVWWARPGFVAAGAFLLFVAVLAVWVATSSPGTTPDVSGPTTMVTTLSPARGETAKPPSSPTSSLTVATDPALPTAGPADVSWDLWKGVALPVSPTAGPANVHDGVAESYARTPEGALVAAPQIMYRAAYGPTEQVVKAQVVDGSGRDKLLAQSSPSRGTDGGVPQVAGFKFDSYSPDRADIQLVVRTGQGALTSFLLRLEWDGDWRLVPTLDGEIIWSTTSLPTIAGYITWSGVA